MAEALLCGATTVIGLTAVNPVVARTNEELARFMPTYEPIVVFGVLVSSIVVAFVLASVVLKSSAIRRRAHLRERRPDQSAERDFLVSNTGNVSPHIAPLPKRLRFSVLIVCFAAASGLGLGSWKIPDDAEAFEPPSGLNVSADRLVDAYEVDAVAAGRAYSTRWLSLDAEVANVPLRVDTESVVQLKTTRQRPSLRASFASDADDVFGDLQAGAFVSLRCRGAVFQQDVLLKACSLQSLSNHR